MSVTYLVGAAVIGCAGALISKSKNRNQVAWGIVCFLFGIIPLIVLLFLSPLPVLPESNTEHE